MQLTPFRRGASSCFSSRGSSAPSGQVRHAATQPPPPIKSSQTTALRLLLGCVVQTCQPLTGQKEEQERGVSGVWMQIRTEACLLPPHNRKHGCDLPTAAECACPD